MFMSAVNVRSMTTVQMCPEEQGMQNKTLTGFKMELNKTDVVSFGSRQLDIAMRRSLQLTFRVLQSFNWIENTHKPSCIHGRETGLAGNITLITQEFSPSLFKYINVTVK